MKKNIPIASIFLFIFFSNTISAQKKPLQLGGKLITEFKDWKTYEPGLGVQVIKGFSKHSGVESGCYYKIAANDFFYYDINGNLYLRSVKEKTILVHLLYRFDSKFLNFTAGPGLEYIMGLQKREKDPPVYLSPYDAKRVQLITTVSLSKSLWLNRTLVLEPELRASAFVPKGGGGMSLNISLRKKLF